MLKRGTVLLLMSAITLGGGVLLFENIGSNGVGNESATPGLNTLTEGDGEPLLPFAEEDIDSFVVTRLNDTLTFNKSDEGTWQMVQPETGIAEGGAVAFLLSQLTGPTIQSITVESADNLSDFGLADPNSTVDVTAGEQSYQIAVGGGDFSGDKRYVRLLAPVEKAPLVDNASAENESAENESADADGTDSSEESVPIQIHVVSGGIVNAVERPTAEWLMPTALPAASEPSNEASELSNEASEPSDESSNEPTTEPMTDIGGE